MSHAGEAEAEADRIPTAVADGVEDSNWEGDGAGSCCDDDAVDAAADDLSLIHI